MARRRNTGLYEDLSPSLVVPDHFSTSQSSTIVIIYDEQVGMKEDQLTFIFPGEVSGGPLKRVVPKRIDSRTFVLETPTYRILKRGFVYITPQLKLYSGELAEMADFKISLKHPVRSVMEMCLNLSTQDAVLPVLLTLIIHSKQDGEEPNHFFQDPHFDQIMATLVGSMEPKKHHIKDLILPDKKWRRVHLTEFARSFGMQEMEKQAYLLSKRSKEKRKVDKHHGDTAASEVEDAEDSLFQSQYLSSSTPNINQASSGRFSFPHGSKSIGKAETCTPQLRKKKLPKVPKKKNKSVEDIWAVGLDSHQSISSRNETTPSVFETSTYDEVQFDTGVPEEANQPIVASTEPNLKRPKLPKLRAPIIPMAQKTKAKEEDTESLDSYEEMNEVPWEAKNLQMPPPDLPTVPPPLPPSKVSVDDRPMMPLPNNSPKPSGTTPIHYTLSTKQKSKGNKKVDENRPLPLPPEPKFPPPPSKPPLPNPKPPELKNQKTPRRRFTRRRKDVYVSDSDSDTDDMQNDMPANSVPSRQKQPHANEARAPVDPFKDDSHMYDSAEVVPAKKSKGGGGAAVGISNGDTSLLDRTSKLDSLPRYENVEVEPSYDENPTLPPRNSNTIAPSSDAPALPPRQSPKKFATSNHIPDLPSHHLKSTPPSPHSKPLPTPPAKPKPAGPTLPPKLPSPGQRQNFPPSSSSFSPKLALKRTAQHQQQLPPKIDQMSELSNVLSNRNAVRASGEMFPLPPPVALKKNHWKQNY